MNQEVERKMNGHNTWANQVRRTGMAASADEAGRASGPEYGWPQWSLYLIIYYF